MIRFTLAFIASLVLISSAKFIAIPHLSNVEYESLLSSGIDSRGQFKSFSIFNPQRSSEMSYFTTRFPHLQVIEDAFDSEEHSFAVLERDDEDSSWIAQIQTSLLKTQVRILFGTEEDVLVAFPKDIIIYEVEMPDNTHIFVLPTKSFVSTHTKTIDEIRSSFRKNDFIQEIVDEVDTENLRQNILFLTGERNDSFVYSRNSFASDTVKFASWLSDTYKSYGFTPSIEYFTSGYAPNVIATFKGEVEPEKIVVIGAHYDSRATDRSSATQRAPGANDDGSGTATLIELARLVSQRNIRFRYTVVIGSWSGEEQGLYGSRAYAKKCFDAKVDVVSMIQGDMLAYRKSGEVAQCAFPTRYHTPSLTSLLKNVVSTYVPQIKVCDTSACCSDHQSFFELGYPATQFFERCGSIADVQYHKEGDLLNRPDFDMIQLTYNARAMIASLLVLAEVVEN